MSALGLDGSDISWFIDNKWLVTILLFTALFLLRFGARAGISRLTSGSHFGRRIIVLIENIITLLLAFGVIAIWASEIREAALSIAAFAVAIAFALRDSIQSLMGGIYQASRRSFTIGDWVEIGNYVGEVLDKEWLSTTLLEIDTGDLGSGYTGSTLFIPNNIFISTPVKNLNFLRHYIEHSFSITYERRLSDPVSTKAFIEKQIEEYSVEFQKLSERYMGLVNQRIGVDIGFTEPRVRISFNEWAHCVITVKLLCPRKEAIDIEQRLIVSLLRFWNSE